MIVLYRMKSERTEVSMDKQYKLENVILHITDACESRCPYCYASSDMKNYHHADVDKIYSIIKELSKASVSHISLLGGDPILHPQLIDIAKKIRSYGISPSVMSNTMRFSESFDEIVQIFDLFETTIHGECSGIHDRFSGNPGVYDLLVHNLKELSERNAEIGIAVNIIPQNCENIYNMIASLVQEHNIKLSYVILQRIVPYGRACSTNQYRLNLDEINIALENVYRINKELGVNILVEDPFPLCKIDPKYRHFMQPCSWGFSKAALNGKGDMTRCGADSRYLLGNIFERDILDIWDNSPYLKEFREKTYLPDTCHRCPMFEQCGGGCAVSNNPVGDAGEDYLLNIH